LVCKLPIAKAYGLSIKLRTKLHSNIVPNHIWTHEPVYWDSPAGKLELAMVSRFVPLQQGFRGYGKTCFPIAVHDEAALASEQGIVGGIMASPDSTAAGTPLTRMPTINNVQRDSFIETSLLKIPSERVERNTHHLSVEPFPFRVKPLQIFNANVSIILEREIGYISNYFTNPVLHEIMLPMLGRVKLLLSRLAASISVGTQKTLALKYFLASHPNILAKICLLQDFAFRGQNGESEAFTVNIHAENVLSLKHITSFFGEIGNDFKVRGQSEGFANPSSPKQAVESIPIPVLLDGDRNPLSRGKSKFNKSEPSSLEGLTVTGNIEFSSHPTNAHAFLLFSPSASGKVADHLTVETCSLLGFGADAMPKIVESFILAPFREQPIDFNTSGLLKAGKNLLFDGSGFGLEKYRSLQPTDQQANQSSQCLSVSTQFLPPVNGVGFLGAF